MDHIALQPFGEIALLLALAAMVGLAGSMLRQPLIVSFIVVGLIVGPSGLDLVRSDGQIDLLGDLGIAMLLFLVGIKLDMKLIRSLGAVALTTGLGQVALSSIGGYGIGMAFGLDRIGAVYVAVALAFSSTIIVVKLLSDKREIDSLHGQIALGLLIVQDLVVVVAMIVLSAVGLGEASGHGGAGFMSAVLSGLAMIAVVILFARFAATPLTGRLARSPELLVLFAVALAAIFAAVGDVLGLGKEVGGLMAGVALASTPYREAISSRLAPLRDFLLLFFFIALGSSLNLSLLGGNLPAALTLSAFVLIGKPVIMLGIMTAMGYGRRTGFLAGVTVAQISEFSLIFMAMGLSIGHVGEDALGLVTMVGLITIAASTYMITYSHKLYALCEPMLARFRGARSSRDDAAGAGSDRTYQVVLFGLGRFGTAIGLRLEKRGIRTLGVDFNPLAVRRWRTLGLPACYGDATDAEFIAELPLRDAQWLVLSVPQQAIGLSHEDARATMLQIARAGGFRGRIAVTSHSAEDTGRLVASGADLVFEPFQDAADRAVDLLCGSSEAERTLIPEIDSEGRALA